MPPPASARPARAAWQLAVREAELLEEAAGALEAVAPEPAEQLLSAVAEEQHAHDDPYNQKSQTHSFPQ